MRKKGSKVVSGDKNGSQNFHNKRQCSDCGITTHKKGGILGKKLIPITVEGQVYQGRCLICDPFPSKAPNVAIAQVDCKAQEDEEHSDRQSIDDVQPKNENSTPTTRAGDVVVDTTAAQNLMASKNKPGGSADDELEKNEVCHETEEKDNQEKTSRRKTSLDSQLREQEQYNQNEHRLLQTAPTSNLDVRGADHPAIVPSMTIPMQRVSTSVRATANDVPKTLEVIRRGPPRGGDSSIGGNGYSNASDEHSIVSAITMDMHLYQPFVVGEGSLDDNVNATDDDLAPPNFHHRRPGPERMNSRAYNKSHKNHTRRHSTGGDADSYRYQRHRSFNNNNLTSSNHGGPSRYNQMKYPNTPPLNGTRMDAYLQPLAPSQAAAVMEARSYIGSRSRDENAYHFSDQVAQSKIRATDTNNKTRTAYQDNEFQPEDNMNQRRKNHPTMKEPQRASSILDGNKGNKDNLNHEISENQIIPNKSTREPQSFGTSAKLTDDDDFPSFIMDDNDYDDSQNYNQNVLRQQPSLSTLSSGHQFNKTNDSGHHKRSFSTSNTITEEHDIDDLTSLFRCLNLEECNPDIREQALSKLVYIMQSMGENYVAEGRKRHIREFILENDVIEAVTKSMWADMEIVEVQLAAMNVLLFIASSMDFDYTSVDDDNDQRTSGGNSSLLSKNESVVDSILFTMQNHVTVHEIQLKGSLIFASLAASSFNNGPASANSDGCLSGALTMVLNAMSNHGNSRPIRKAGLQALHHQCLLSAYAEDNKRNFVESKLGNGMPALDLVIYAMEELYKDVLAMEWACELCWCLTANEDLLNQIANVSLHEGTMTICQHYMTNPTGIGLVEACIGTIANLAFLERKRNEMINSGAIELVLDGLRYHGDDFGISYEAALALENFNLPPYLPELSLMFLKSDTVPLLVKGLQTFIEYPEYVIQGIRALTGFAARCDEAKEKISSPELMSIVHESMQNHKNADVLHVCSTFVATLADGETSSISDFMIEHGAVDLLLFSMECCPDEKVQDAACLALRNLSCHVKNPEELLKDDKTLKFVVGAMDTHRNSVSVQTNGCCTFWNLLSKVDDRQFAFNQKIVPSITQAMQSHIESADLLELACGALWAIVDKFDDQKVHIGNEAIDVVTCAMVMHPDTVSTLEMACGFLSNLSSDESLAKSIAKAQGVSIVSEAMCNNASSISLLESGCLTLKNLILACPSYTQDGAVAISTLVIAVNKNSRSPTFVKEACDMLWVIASENENIRSKILALDGISILMNCLEQNSNHPEVETAILGAFYQLTKANS